MTEKTSDVPEPADDDDDDDAPYDAAATVGRPDRPPVQQTTADVLLSTQPGRIQLAAERVWTTAILLAAIGLLTGWLTHSVAVTELLDQVPANVAEADRRKAAELLHTLTLVWVAVGIAVEAVLVAFLRRRLVILRVLMNLLALVNVLLLQLILGIAMVPGWRGILIAIMLGAHGLLVIVGSVLIWLPPGRPRRV